MKAMLFHRFYVAEKIKILFTPQTPSLGPHRATPRRRAILGILFALGMVVGCKEPATVTYTVTFNSNGGTAVATATVKSGEQVKRPTPNPTKEDNVFIDWYADQGFSQPHDFDTPITKNITLYARWNLQNVPDAIFRTALKGIVPKAFTGDWLDTTHADVTGLIRLDVSNKSISNLRGIEYFTSLTTLFCSRNQLTDLDVSHNTALTSLDCSNNQLKHLDVSANTSLNVLRCFNNALTVLKVSTKLTELNCDNNQLPVLDVSTNTSLERLRCSENQLTVLDVSSNASLTYLSCSQNQLTDLDVSHNTALTSLDCSNNQLTVLDITGMRSATNLTINTGVNSKNPITTLKVHDNLKNNAELIEAKTNRGVAIKIATYTTSAGLTDYTLSCASYAPAANGGGRCVTDPPVTTVPEPPHVFDDEKVVVGYLQHFRSINDVKWSEITHLIYTFVYPKADGTLDTSQMSQLPSYVAQAKANNVKILVSIGGWTYSGKDTRVFTKVIKNERKRTKLVESINTLIRDNALDGIDIDYEELVGGGATVDNTETNKLLPFYQELRKTLPHTSLITAAVTGGYGWAAYHFRDIARGMAKVLDFISVMSYDNLGTWGSSPLGDPSSVSDAQSGLARYVEFGASKNKLVLGVPFYGRDFLEATGGLATAISYSDIVKTYTPTDAEFSAGHINRDGHNIYFNSQTIISQKVSHVKDNDFRGISIWELGQDTKTKDLRLLKNILNSF